MIAPLLHEIITLCSVCIHPSIGGFEGGCLDEAAAGRSAGWPGGGSKLWCDDVTVEIV
jgi:hypothetical protein